MGSEFELWESVKGSEGPADFKDYLTQYPSGIYADEARSQRQALIAAAKAERLAAARELWELVKDSQNPADFEGYLSQYPSGTHADEACSRQLALIAAWVAELEPRQSFSDELGSGGKGPEMVVIRVGRFRMGCVSGGYCGSSAKPVHEVRIAKPFALSKYEVTFAHWDACVADGGCGGYKPDDWDRDNRPVISVSWEDAM